MASTIATSDAPADTPDPSVHGEEEPMRRSTSVFRCLFPHGWEDSSQEANVTDEYEAAADSHAGSQPTDDDDETTPVMPATLPDNVSTPARDDEYNPEVPTFINDVTPEVSVSPDDPAANERSHALADKSAAPDTPATPVNSAPDVPPTPVNNASTDGDDTSPTDSVSQTPSASTTDSQACDVGERRVVWYRHHGARRVHEARLQQSRVASHCSSLGETNDLVTPPTAKGIYTGMRFCCCRQSCLSHSNRVDLEH